MQRSGTILLWSSKCVNCLSCRKASFIASAEKYVAQSAASTFIESLEENSKIMDIPTIVIADPANVSSWNWSASIDSQPMYSRDQLIAMASKSEYDPFSLVAKDVSNLSDGIKELLGSDHPVLEQCAQYFFNIDGGKKVRPVMVLLISYALSGLGHALPAQKRLAEITEMIHTASLFHDDVIDKATTRRGFPTVNQVFGNKLAILGGDFLLSRASVSLARLRNLEVVEILSTVIEHLVKGEIMQMKPTNNNSQTALIYCLRKNYYKTASLMGNSCLAAAVLCGTGEEYKKASYLYGTYIGQAFQLIDDALDFEGSITSIGKAPLADIKSGLTTAPTIFACTEYPELIEMIGRKFEKEGDVEKAHNLVIKSSGLKKTKELAQVHAEHAIHAITTVFPQSPATDALLSLAVKIITRSN